MSYRMSNQSINQSTDRTTSQSNSRSNIQSNGQSNGLSKTAPVDGARPVFMTRQQREAAATQRLEEQRKKRVEEVAKIQAVVNQSINQSNNQSSNQTDGALQKNSSSTQSSTQIRSNTHRDRRPNGTSSNDTTFSQSAEEIALREKELALIRATHLGQKLDAPKPKVVKQSAFQKQRLAFEWNESDDTANDPYALYTKRHEANLLYGRGYLGGVDRVEQKKKSATSDAERARLLDRESNLIASSRHWRDKSLDEMTERDWRIFREDFEITTRGLNIPRPLRFWNEGNLHPSLLRSIEVAGFKEPSPIQRAAIPIGLQNRDIIGIAETGSGKTAAFLIPMLTFIASQPRVTPATAELGPYALVMAPTRELAQQISAECDKFARDLGIRNACVVGGATIEEQGLRLREGVELVIGTPGRLIDCIEKHFLVLDQCLYVVLDEADRMIDMNFEPQINAVMDQMPATNLRPAEESPMDVTESSNNQSNNQSVTKKPRYRQTVMFTATMPPKVAVLAKKYLRSPVEIAVGDRRGKANTNVDQEVIWCNTDNDKRAALIRIISNEKPPIIVFCNLKRTCDFISRTLTDIGIKCMVIHGSKAQDQREEALSSFKSGAIDVLVATDVLGRGIDINDVRHVINFEMPQEMDRFTHRIGRTGRAGKKGKATSLINEADSSVFFELRTMLEQAHQPVPSQLAHHEAAKFKQFDSNKRQKV